MDNKRSLIVTLALLLVTIVVYSFVFIPLKDTNGSRKEEIALLEADLGRLQEQAAPTQDDAENVGEIDERIVGVSIPDRFDQDDLIEQVSTLAAGNNIKIENLSFGRGTTTNEFIDSVQVAMNVSGGLYGFLEFMRALEAEERFYNIQNFTLSIGETEPIQVNFSVNFEVYHS